MRSIRRRTLIMILGLVVLGLVSLTLSNIHDSNHEIAEVYDAQLAQHARLLQGIMSMPLTRSEHDQLYRAFNKALSAAQSGHDGHPYESKMAFKVWDAEGDLLVHTASAPSLTERPLRAGYDNVIDISNGKWRSFVLLDSAQGLTIWVGERNDVRADLVDRIVRHTILPTLLGSLVLLLAIWLAIGWGLKPLVNLAAVLRARHPGSLEALQLEPLPSELEPMQTALNRLLGQIQEVLDRERRFIADAAHEMRTPLAVLKVHAQNMLQARNDAERQASLEYLVVGVDRTTRLVNQLLTIARLEPGAGSVGHVSSDVVKAIRDCLVQMTPWVLSKGLEMSFECSDEAHEARTDLAALDIALQNLISNAVNFSLKEGLITVRLSFPEGRLQLSVEDQGPGIDEQELNRLFERFYSRGNDQGAGLGLAIVQQVAQQLGGEVKLENLAVGLRASLRVPLQQ